MNSTSFIRTEAGGCYLYDATLQHLLNVHPVIETIHRFAYEATDNDTVKCLREKHPELTDTDIELYLKKYDCLKNHGFFEGFNFDGIFSCDTTANQIENQLIHLDVITFQVTGACNLKCRYCCYGEMYDNKHERRFNYRRGGAHLLFLG